MAELAKGSSLYDIGAVLQGEGVVTNLEYHREGKWLAMSDGAGSIHLIDALTGEHKKKIYSKSNGIGKIKYTHHEHCILTSSERNNNDIQYLCMYDNRCLRIFGGHTEKITSISMSPVDDCFLTTGNDKSVRLWNLNSTKSAIAKISLPAMYHHPTASFDESGLIFGVMSRDLRSNKHSLKLFDSRNYSAGPFQDIVPNMNLIESAMAKANPSLSIAQLKKSLYSGAWNSFEFSTDGNNVLVNTNSDFVFLLDGFRPDVAPMAFYRKNESGLSLGACLSATCSFITVANEDNGISMFDTLAGTQKDMLTGHVSPVGCIQHNPRYEEIASGCVNTVLWIVKHGMPVA